MNGVGGGGASHCLKNHWFSGERLVRRDCQATEGCILTRTGTPAASVQRSMNRFARGAGIAEYLTRPQTRLSSPFHTKSRTGICSIKGWLNGNVAGLCALEPSTVCHGRTVRASRQPRRKSSRNSRAGSDRSLSNVNSAHVAARQWFSWLLQNTCCMQFSST